MRATGPFLSGTTDGPNRYTARTRRTNWTTASPRSRELFSWLAPPKRRTRCSPLSAHFGLRRSIRRSNQQTLLNALNKLLVLEADLVNQFCVDNDALSQCDGPGLCVRLGIIHGDFDLEMPEI